MCKLNFWPFGGKPQVANPNDKIVKTSILLMKETILGFPYSGNSYHPEIPDSTITQKVTFTVGMFSTLQDGRIVRNYNNGYSPIICKTIEEAEMAYEFIVKNNGKIENKETLKETIVVTN